MTQMTAMESYKSKKRPPYDNLFYHKKTFQNTIYKKASYPRRVYNITIN